MQVANLKTEYLTNPLGIDITNPHLSWKIVGPNIKKQTGFEILYKINDSSEEKVSQVSSSTYYKFNHPLKSRDFVTWKIRVKNEKDEWSDFSDEQHFSIGLLHKDDWYAKWIRGDYSVCKKKRYPVDYFKKDFIVTDVKNATLYITALGIYEAYLNGRKIGNAYLTPGSTNPRKRVHYDTYNVAPLMKKGSNELVILLADGWHRGSIGAKGFTYVFGKYIQVLAQLEITTNSGQRQLICTDNTWKWSNDGPLMFADLKDGEIVNFNNIPTYSGKVKVANYRNIISASNNSHVVAIARNKPINENMSLTGKKVYEFANNVAGFIALKLKAERYGKVRVVLGELIDENGDVTLHNIQCVRKGKKTPLQEILIICKEGMNEYETKFFYGGFKYASVVVDGDVEIKEIKQVAISSEMDETSTFECSHPLINIFYDNTKRSIKSNFVDIPTDCPTRERMGWLGDSQLIFETASFLFDCHAFFRKHLRDVYDRQGNKGTKKGRLPQIAPYAAEDWFMDVMNGSVGWADAGVLIPYRMYLKYGNLDILKKHYDGMVSYAKFMIRRTGRAKGIYAIYAKPLRLSRANRKYQVNSGQHYGEWAEPHDVKPYHWTDFAVPKPEESMAYTSHIMRLMVKISKLVGRHEHIALFAEYRDGVKRAYQELITTPNHNIDTDRQCKQVRPLYFELLAKEQTEFAKQRLLKSLDNYGWRLGTGFLSTPFILYVLEKINPEYAYKLLLNEKMPGWLYMAKENTGTIWEGWEGPKAQLGISSLNHYSKGAMVEWLFKSMLGIKIKGENTFEVSPIIGKGVNYAHGSYDSKWGKIAVSWHKEKEEINFKINIPPNTNAEFIFNDVNKILEPGSHTITIKP